MKKYTFIFLSFLLLSSCYQKQKLDFSNWYTVEEGGDTPDPETIEGLFIMSSNVRYYSARSKKDDPDVGDRDWEVRKTGYFEMVNTMKPTVLGLQEAEMNQVSDIIANCKGYAYKGVGRKDGRQNGESTSILYRVDEIQVEEWGTVWLSDTPTVVASHFAEMTDNQCRTATWAILTVKESGRRFFYLNTHTSLFEDSQPKEIACILNTVSEHCPDGLPVVLSADWNLEENDPIMAPVLKDYSSARQTAPLTDNIETFHWWGSQSTISKHQHLDHIFYRGFEGCSRFRTLNMKWKNLWISDHHPVYAILQFKSGDSSHKAPVADFELPANPVMDEVIKFTDKSISEYGIESWSWNIGGILSTEQNPEVVFNTFGDNIPVTLTVTDSYGVKGSATKTFSVTRSGAHDLKLEWSQSYDESDGAYVYWTSAAVNASCDRIYVTSSGNHLVCFDSDGNQIGSYDIGEYGPYHGDSKTHCCPTPSVDEDGNVYIPVQYGYSPENGSGGFYSIKPDCAGVNWYCNSGAKSQYEYMIPALFEDKVAVVLRGGDGDDSQYVDSNGTRGNMVIMNRSDHGAVLTLQPDGGSYGGMAIASDKKIVFSANKVTDDLKLGTGYKVAIPDGNTWKTSSNLNAGKRANLLSGTNMQPKGCQPAISKDGTIYLCSGTVDGGELVCARYDLASYQIVENTSPTPIWKVSIPATVARNGYGCVLDDEGNAYYLSGKSVFRLNGTDGKKAWEVALTEGNSGNCGVPAIDQLGYLYVCDLNGHRLLKLSTADGKIVSELPLGDSCRPRSCPTITKDGSIYLNVNLNSHPTLLKITCPKTSGPGSNWSQLGGNYRKTCNVADL